MLVEINLLPKKEHTQSSKLMITLISVLLFAATASLIYLQGNSLTNRIETADKELASIQELNKAQQEKMADSTAANSAAKLEDAVEWAKHYPVTTVPLLREIIALLPERGFIQNLEYNNVNSVFITLQFDASRDAAFYLSALKQADWVQDVAILTVVAEEAEEQSMNLNSDETGKVLPRYSAEFEITFKSESFKQDGADAEAGGEGP